MEIKIQAYKYSEYVGGGKDPSIVISSDEDRIKMAV